MNVPILILARVALQADVVLHSVLNNSVTTLPDIHDKHASTREPSDAGSYGKQSSLLASLGSDKVRLADPETAARDRSSLGNLYGVSKPHSGDGTRGLGPNMRKYSGGKRTRKKTAEPGLVIPAKYRNDPGAVMPISENEAQKGGIYQLVNRG